MAKNQFTKEQLKEALNQLVDMIYEKQEEVNLTEHATKRLLSTIPVSQLVNNHVDIRPSESPTTLLDTKMVLMSKKQEKGYQVDIDMLKEMYEEFINLTSYEVVKDPQKSKEIMEDILRYNSTNVTGYGRVTEKHVYSLEKVGEEIGLEPLAFLSDKEEA